MNIEEIKKLLPHGSYQKIADQVGKSYGTVRDVFNKKIDDRISEQTRSKIIERAKAMIEARSWDGLDLLHGEDKVNEMKAALAA